MIQAQTQKFDPENFIFQKVSCFMWLKIYKKKQKNMF